jgi:hypothetical protein
MAQCQANEFHKAPPEHLMFLLDIQISVSATSNPHANALGMIRTSSTNPKPSLTAITSTPGYSVHTRRHRRASRSTSVVKRDKEPLRGLRGDGRSIPCVPNVIVSRGGRLPRKVYIQFEPGNVWYSPKPGMIYRPARRL